jgi:hypothetical protein
MTVGLCKIDSDVHIVAPPMAPTPHVRATAFTVAGAAGAGAIATIPARLASVH